MHSNPWLDVVGQGLLDAAGGLRGGQRVDDVDGAGEQHRVPAQTSGVAACGHQMALAQAGAGDEYDVGASGHEVQVEQVLDEQPVDLGGQVPVELVERLERGEACLLDAALHAAIFARGGLAGDQLGQVVQVRSMLVGGALGEGLVVVEHERQVQGDELRAQA